MLFFKKKKPLTNEERIQGSLVGLVVGDALGVPVEFLGRETLRGRKIKDMEEFGTHQQPKGTWSDDSSMMLATVDGMTNGKLPELNYVNIMTNFLNWIEKGEFTPFNKVFDAGNATRDALTRYKRKVENGQADDIICGNGDINSNGNGSLMRILPISIYLALYVKDYKDERFMDIVNTVSSMTHSHIYSVLGCYIYSVYISELLKGNDKFTAYKTLQEVCKDIQDDGVYNRILKEDISKLPEQDIKSTGYVVDTLEAAMWSLLTTDNYKDAVLKAVNLGSDTDTVAAVTGGMAGMLYGYDAIPKKWIDSLQKKDFVLSTINTFTHRIPTMTAPNMVFDVEMINKAIEYCEDLIKNNEKEVEIFGEGPVGIFSHHLSVNNIVDYNYFDHIDAAFQKEYKDMTMDDLVTIFTFIKRRDYFEGGGSGTDVKQFFELLKRLKELVEEK